jgi:hypothetical protein
MMSRPTAAAVRRPMETSEKVLAVLGAVALFLVVLQHTGLAPLPHVLDDLLEGMTIGLAMAVAINAALWLTDTDLRGRSGKPR